MTDKLVIMGLFSLVMAVIYFLRAQEGRRRLKSGKIKEITSLDVILKVVSLLVNIYAVAVGVGVFNGGGDLLTIAWSVFPWMFLSVVIENIKVIYRVFLYPNAIT